MQKSMGMYCTYFKEFYQLVLYQTFGGLLKKVSTSWTHEEAQFRWPHSIKKSAQTYIYQIKALEQLNKVTTGAFHQSGLQKKYGTKHVFWDSSG